MMHFPLVSEFSLYFRRISLTPSQIFPILAFSDKRNRFSSAKISDDHFLVITQKFEIVPLYFCFFSPFPYFGRMFHSPTLPTLPNFPAPKFCKIFMFCTCFLLFSFPLLL